jgi:thioredoxin-related protein
MRIALLGSLIVTGLLVTLWVQPAAAIPDGWTEDYAAARKAAKKNDKDLLIKFTGSDWCPPCQMLEKEVFTQKAFTEYAPDEFVRVYLDFPNRKNQSAQVKKQNAQLAEAYAIKGYPTVFLADHTGIPYAKTGYRRGGDAKYVEHLKSLQEVKTERDQAMAEAEKLSGIEKAKKLDDALETVGMELATVFYVDTIKEIAKLDKDDEAGLRSKYKALMGG